MKKRVVILMAALAVIAFIGLSANSNSAKAADEETMYDTSKLVENIGARTETSKTYQLDNGQTLLELFDGPVHYLDSNGDYQNIELDLVQATESKSEEGYSFKNKANSWDVYFADGGKGVPMVQIEKDGLSLGFSLVNSKSESKVSNSSIASAKSSEYHSRLAKETNAAYYENVCDGIDLAYRIGISSVKEEIVINQYTGISSFDFELSLKGLTPQETESGWVFVDESGKEAFGLAGLFMEDANGKFNDNIKLAMKQSDNGNWIMTVTMDEEYLKAEDTVYPVVVDPSVTITGPSDTYDAYVYSKSPTTNTYLSTYLKTGWTSGYYKRRTYVNFDMTVIPSGSTITSALLYLYIQDQNSSTHYTKACKVTASWSSSGITWNNQPGYTTVGQASFVQGASVHTFTVSSIVTSWSPFTNGYGFRVWDSNAEYAEVTNYVDYYSSDYSSSSVRPKLYVIYSGTPVTPTPPPTATPTPTPTPTATPIPTQYVDLSVPCDEAYRVNNSNWQDDANNTTETADNLLASVFGIDFYYKTYVTWTSPADECGDAPSFCRECSCPIDCQACSCSSPGQCDLWCTCVYFPAMECSYMHNEMYTMVNSAYSEIGDRDAVIALTKNNMYEFIENMDHCYDSNYGLAHDTLPACIYRSKSLPYDDSICVMHEFCHIYGAPDCQNDNCVMHYYWDENNVFHYASTSSWCSSCYSTIMSNRTDYGSTSP